MQTDAFFASHYSIIEIRGNGGDIYTFAVDKEHNIMKVRINSYHRYGNDNAYYQVDLRSFNVSGDVIQHKEDFWLSFSKALVSFSKLN